MKRTWYSAMKVKERVSEGKRVFSYDKCHKEGLWDYNLAKVTGFFPGSTFKREQLGPDCQGLGRVVEEKMKAMSVGQSIKKFVLEEQWRDVVRSEEWQSEGQRKDVSFIFLVLAEVCFKDQSKVTSPHDIREEGSYLSKVPRVRRVPLSSLPDNIH